MGRQLPLRVVLVYKGVKTKFFSLFPGKDNSFYIHLYRPPGQPWRIPGGDPSKAGDGRSIIPLDFANFSEPHFDLHKVTFHRSGYIHLTDKERRRYRDGVRGPAFGDIALPYDLCLLVPCKPQMLPMHEGQRGLVFEIGLHDEIGPFWVCLTLIDALSPLPATQGPLIRQPVNFLFPGCDKGIALTMWPVLDEVTRKQLPDWPPFPFFVLRIGA